MKVQIFSDCVKEGKNPEILFWVGCSGSFDERAKKITKAFVKILNDAKIDFAVLGNEESCSGDLAKRSGNEFLFQMQALGNIKVMNSYNVKKSSLPVPIVSIQLKMNTQDLVENMRFYITQSF